MAPRLNILGHAACGWKVKVFSSGGKRSRRKDSWRFANRGKLKAIEKSIDGAFNVATHPVLRPRTKR